MISELFPILATRDVDRVVAFYRDLLGGRVTYEFPGPDGRPAYVALDIGSSHLGIGLESGAPPDASERRGISLWVYTDDCDATTERLRAAGTPIIEEPTDQPWGERVARVRDPDGNEVIVGARAVA
jgi:lactoylglutathione lyase